MSDVQLGDSVLTVDNNNHLAFSPIILHLHRSPNETGRFVVLRTNTEQSLTLSPQHLIYSKKKSKEKDQPKQNANINEFRVVFASDVRKGDMVLVHDHNNNMKYGMVVDIEEIEATGLYSPLTPQGNIIVDDILASCYSDFENHELQHLAFAPIHWIYRLLQFLHLSKIRPDETDSRLNNDDDGVYWYGQGLHVFANAVLPWKVWGGSPLI